MEKKEIGLLVNDIHSNHCPVTLMTLNSKENSEIIINNPDCGIKQSFDRKKYTLEMRKVFSNKNSILPNGDLNHKYFQTKIGQYWSEEDNDNLTLGIELFGIGNWEKIQQENLQTRSATELQLRACLLLKCYNIDKYNGCFLTKKQIDEIADQNVKEGLRLNKFNYGVYLNE